MPIDLSSTVVRADNLMSAPVDKEIVILNMVKNNYIGLDEIGLRIWELIAEPRRVGDLCIQLSREFEATPEQIADDVLPFLAELEDENLVRIA